VAAEVELRFVPRRHDLATRIAHSGLPFGLARMRNAGP
jgi:hypothetical protein